MLLVILGAILGQIFPIFFPEPFTKLKAKVLQIIKECKDE